MAFLHQTKLRVLDLENSTASPLRYPAARHHMLGAGTSVWKAGKMWKREGQVCPDLTQTHPTYQARKFNFTQLPTWDPLEGLKDTGGASHSASERSFPAAS